jgi:hypothetical protein
MFVHTIKLSVSLPDDAHQDFELRISADDGDCDVLIALPVRPQKADAVPTSDADDAAAREQDAYVLGGYAGI